MTRSEGYRTEAGAMVTLLLLLCGGKFYAGEFPSGSIYQALDGVFQRRQRLPLKRMDGLFDKKTGICQTERVIYFDTETGAEVWRILPEVEVYPVYNFYQQKVRVLGSFYTKSPPGSPVSVKISDSRGT